MEEHKLILKKLEEAITKLNNEGIVPHEVKIGKWEHGQDDENETEPKALVTVSFYI